MSDGPIVVIDYGAGNLRSVARALAHVGEEALVTTDPAVLRKAAGAILPGVGAAQDTMANLSARRMVEPIREFISSGRPFLGVCMGLQALFEWSDEGAGQACLGVLRGKIRHFAPASRDLKVPHMGWNTAHWLREHPLLNGIPTASYFYFVHSFYAEPTIPDITLGETEYGVRFASVVARDNVVATQFHPEKSGAAGLRIYGNFCRWVRTGAVVPASSRS